MSYKPEIIGEFEKATNVLKREYEERTKPESIYIYITLKNIIEGFADNAHHSDFRGTLRNDGLTEICLQLNRLQKELQFQKPYKVELT